MRQQSKLFIDYAILANHINREIHIAIIVIVSAWVPAEVDARANGLILHIWLIDSPVKVIRSDFISRRFPILLWGALAS